MEWRSLTKKQKLARLEKQLKEIEKAQELLNEFERLTNDWKKKVTNLSPDDAAKK